jgi:twitching motility protein PilT
MARSRIIARRGAQGEGVSMSALGVLFDEVVRRGASDLHLAVEYPPLARVDGDLVQLRELALSARDLEAMLLDLVPPTLRSRLATNLDLGFALEHRDGVRFRARYFMTDRGLGAAFRRVPARAVSIRELGLPDTVVRLAERRGGLVVVAGPSASGKTTTVAAMVDHINASRRCHIVTIEDPIEFVHESRTAQVTHRQLGDHASSMRAALTGALREDVDVVFAPALSFDEGELGLAIELALGGVLVLTTVEASSASSALGWLARTSDPARSPYLRGLLAECVVGVIVQDTVRADGGPRRPIVREVIAAERKT